jgi:UDP-glucose 4-epimerase/UDP-glucuronate decarboxylase
MIARDLVTGAAGLIGHAIARQLVEAGREVVALDSGVKGPIADLDALASASKGRLHVVRADLAAAKPHLAGPFETVYHLAAIVGVRYVSEHPWDTLRVNLRSTLNALELAREVKARAFFFASSSENYASGADAGQVAIPTPEDVALSIADIALPRWSYAASKIAGESATFAMAREAGFAPVVGRFHNVYGPRMPPTHVIPELVERCHAREDPLVVLGPEQTRSFLHVDDAARAVRLCVDAALKGAPGIYHIGCGEETRIEDLARLVLDACGHKARIEARPAPPGSVRRRVPDVARLAKLGFRPTIGLADGVRQCWSARQAVKR